MDQPKAEEFNLLDLTEEQQALFMQGYIFGMQDEQENALKQLKLMQQDSADLIIRATYQEIIDFFESGEW